VKLPRPTQPKLLGPAKWTYYYLYVILDIYSRYVVGWMLASRENADLAKRLIHDSIQKQNIRADALTIHSDRAAIPGWSKIALIPRRKSS